MTTPPNVKKSFGGVCYLVKINLLHLFNLEYEGT